MLRSTISHCLEQNELTPAFKIKCKSEEYLSPECQKILTENESNFELGEILKLEEEVDSKDSFKLKYFEISEGSAKFNKRKQFKNEKKSETENISVFKHIPSHVNR